MDEGSNQCNEIRQMSVLLMTIVSLSADAHTLTRCGFNLLLAHTDSVHFWTSSCGTRSTVAAITHQVKARGYYETGGLTCCIGNSLGPKRLNAPVNGNKHVESGNSIRCMVSIIFHLTFSLWLSVESIKEILTNLYLGVVLSTRAKCQRHIANKVFNGVVLI